MNGRRTGRVACGTAAALTVLALTAAVAAASATIAGRDHTPPVFTGLKSATTCVGGPIGGGRTTRYTLSWDAASDNRTPPKKLVYDVYQATVPGGEGFSAPTYTTRKGVTSFKTPQLPTDTNFYFVVRARDRAGNEDANTVERQGVNLCV